jgi:thiol-disulfide isomerase/thioredoxin
VYSQQINFFVQIKVNGLPPGTYPAILAVLNDVNKTTRYTDTISSDKNIVKFYGSVNDEAKATITIGRQMSLTFSIGNKDSVFIELTSGRREEYKIWGSEKAKQMADYLYHAFIPQSISLNKQTAFIDSLQLHQGSDFQILQAKIRRDSLYYEYYKFNVAFADTTQSAEAVYWALSRYMEDTGKINISPQVEYAVYRFGEIASMKALVSDYEIKQKSFSALNVNSKMEIKEYFEPVLSNKINSRLKTNKLVLIDFWASWCTPCREEFPFLKRAFQQYHSKKFDIVSISLDSDKSQWQKAVNNSSEFLLWENQLIDPKGWNSKTVKKLNIKAIPRNYLIDSSGKIYAKDLRGAELIEILGKLL